MKQTYCVKCKRKTETKNPSFYINIIKNSKRFREVGECSICEHRKSSFVSKSEIDKKKSDNENIKIYE